MKKKLSSELNFKYYINGSEQQQQQNSLITNPYICTARLREFKITHGTYKICREPHHPMNLGGSLQRVIAGSLRDSVHNLILEPPRGAESTDILVREGDFKTNTHWRGCLPSQGLLGEGGDLRNGAAK